MSGIWDFKASTLDLTAYAGVIFDCDGTLVDTMPMHYTAWTEVLKSYGIQLTWERFFQMGGISTEKTAEILALEAGIQIDPKALSLEKDNRFLENLHLIQPIDKVVGIAKKAYGILPLGVATGATRRCAELELRQVRIRDLFTVIVAAEDVRHYKPSPDVYLKAAKLLNVDPQRCLAFEDTPIGLKAAQAAGMTAIDVADLR